MSPVKMTSTRAMQLLSERKLLPVLSSVMEKLDEVINNPTSSTEDVAAIVAADVILASKIMRAASSSRYGMSMPKNLLEAVAKLGMKEVRAIAFAVSLSKSLAKTNAIDLKTFWQHSFASAVATREVSNWLTKEKKRPVCDEATAFLLGLSHEMGVMLLALLDGAQYAKVVQAVSQGKDQLFAEQEHVGLTHAVMSSALMHHLKFPDQVATALAGHHYPVRLQPVTQIWADVVLMGEAMAASLGYTNAVYQGLSDNMELVVSQRKMALQLDASSWGSLSKLVASNLKDEGWLELVEDLS